MNHCFSFEDTPESHLQDAHPAVSLFMPLPVLELLLLLLIRLLTSFRISLDLVRGLFGIAVRGKDSSEFFIQASVLSDDRTSLQGFWDVESWNPYVASSLWHCLDYLKHVFDVLFGATRLGCWNPCEVSLLDQVQCNLHSLHFILSRFGFSVFTRVVLLLQYRISKTVVRRQLGSRLLNMPRPLCRMNPLARTALNILERDLLSRGLCNLLGVAERACGSQDLGNRVLCRNGHMHFQAACTGIEDCSILPTLGIWEEPPMESTPQREILLPFRRQLPFVRGIVSVSLLD